MRQRNILLLAFLLNFISYGFSQSKGIIRDIENAREASKGTYVLTKDSVKHAGESIKVSYNIPLMDRDFLKLDGKKIKMSEVLEYQHEGRFSKLVDEQRKIFSPRIRKGKLNVYIDFAWTNNVMDRGTFYIETKSQKIIKCNYTTLESMIKDNQKALDKLNEYFPEKAFPSFKLEKKEYNKILEVFDLYNL